VVGRGEDGGHAGSEATATTGAAMAGEEAATRAGRGKDLGHVRRGRGGILIIPPDAVAVREARGLGGNGDRACAPGLPPGTEG
jgi:hypothetical protein